MADETEDREIERRLREQIDRAARKYASGTSFMEGVPISSYDLAHYAAFSRLGVMGVIRAYLDFCGVGTRQAAEQLAYDATFRQTPDDLEGIRVFCRELTVALDAYEENREASMRRTVQWERKTREENGDLTPLEFVRRNRGE